MFDQLGRAISSAGNVAAGWRESELAELEAHEQRLRIQALNRMEDVRRRALTSPGPGAVQLPQFDPEVPRILEAPEVLAPPPVATPTPPAAPPGKPAVPPPARTPDRMVAPAPDAAALRVPQIHFNFGDDPARAHRVAESLFRQMRHQDGTVNQAAFEAVSERLRGQIAATAGDRVSPEDIGLRGRPAQGPSGRHLWATGTLGRLQWLFDQARVAGRVSSPEVPVMAHPGAQSRVLVPALGPNITLPTAQADRLDRLSRQLQGVANTPDARALVDRARVLGVEPAAALASWGLESAFGRGVTSGAGARGRLQVTERAYRDVQESVLGPQWGNLFTSEQRSAAAALPALFANANEQQLTDAGLLYKAVLRRRYNIPENAIGSAYHAGPRNAHRSVLDRHVGVWSGDHGAMWVGLHNLAATALAGRTAQGTISPDGRTAQGTITPARPPAPLAQQAQAQPPAPLAQQAQAQPPAPLAQQAQAQPPAAPVAAAQPPTIRLPDDAFFRANQQAVSRETQVALNARAELVHMAELYRRSGMANEFMAMRARVVDLDNQLWTLQGMQGINELTTARDPRRLASVWSQALGTPIGIQPRRDGRFNLVINGQLMEEGLSSEDIIGRARVQFDSPFRDQMVQAGVQRSQAMFTNQMAQALAVTKAHADAMGKIAVGMVQRGTELEKVRLGQEEFEARILPTNPNQVVLFRRNGQRVMIVNINPQTQTINGVQVPAPRVTPVDIPR